MPRKSIAGLRGFKVTNVNRKRSIGIACSTLEELKSKGCKKLQVKCKLIFWFVMTSMLL